MSDPFSSGVEEYPSSPDMTVADLGPTASWETCSTPGCVAARVGHDGACLAHMDDDQLVASLAQLDRGAPLDGRGVTFDGSLLRRVLDGLSAEPGDLSVPRPARFDRATFGEDVRFDGVRFWREVRFDGARFSGPASFRGTSFGSHVRFPSVSFDGPAVFDDASFAGHSWFAAATFSDEASFQSANFLGPAWFGGATFQTDVHFDRATFDQDVTFDHAAFRCHSLFTATVFEREAQFQETRFAHEGRFLDAAFKGKGGAPPVAARQMRWSGAILAPWAKRAGAALIDTALPSVVLLASAALAVVAQALQYHDLLPAFLVLGVVLALGLMVRNLVTQGHTGQSLGKRRVGLCLVQQHDGYPVGPLISLVRQGLHLADTVPLLLGWLWPLWDEKRQTFADKIVSTVVVVQAGWVRPTVFLPVAEAAGSGFS